MHVEYTYCSSSFMWHILYECQTMVDTYCVSFSHLKDESMCHLNKHLKQENSGLNCFKE
jgi:hypothetical protein